MDNNSNNNNNNTCTCADITTCDTLNEEPGNTATVRDRVFPVERRSDDDRQMEEIQLPPLQTTSLRSKKLKLNAMTLSVGKGSAVSLGIKQ